MSKVIRNAFVFGALVCAPVATVHAARLGHPGVSTKGATTAQNQWNITCDPAYATNGSFTTDYSSSASISEVDPIFPYKIDSVTVIETNDLIGAAGHVISTAKHPTTIFQTFYPTEGGSVFVNPSAFNGSQSGQVQVKWELLPGQTPPAGTDDNTYSLFFDPNVQGNQNGIIHASFSDVMANYNGANSADFYSGVNPDGTHFTYSADPHSPFYTPNVQTQTVLLSMNLADGEGGGGGEETRRAIPFSASPEPSTLGILGIFGGVGLLRRRRA